jgi:hypothetical protein
VKLYEVNKWSAKYKTIEGMPPEVGQTLRLGGSYALGRAIRDGVRAKATLFWNWIILRPVAKIISIEI